jgi:hypothetical protein
MLGPAGRSQLARISIKPSEEDVRLVVRYEDRGTLGLTGLIVLGHDSEKLDPRSTKVQTLHGKLKSIGPALDYEDDPLRSKLIP